MSKGGGSTRTITQSTSAPEFATPFLEYGLTEAQKLYESGTPQYYPESTVVGFAPETEMALSGMRQQAVSGSPFVPAVQDVVMQNLMGTNPLQSAAMRPVLEATQANLSQAGRYGSGYGQAAIAQALAPIAYQAQQQAIQQAPAARQFGMADLGTLAQVGAAREALSQAELAADVERFQFEQARPTQKLADYMTLVQGGSGALGGQTITPQFRQPALGFLSGGLAGAKAANFMGSTNPAYAIGGALLGGLGS
jgi:hypothetical protein